MIYVFYHNDPLAQDLGGGGLPVDLVAEGLELSETQADAVALLALVAGQDVDIDQLPGQLHFKERDGDFFANGVRLVGARGVRAHQHDVALGVAIDRRRAGADVDVEAGGGGQGRAVGVAAGDRERGEPAGRARPRQRQLRVAGDLKPSQAKAYEKAFVG